MAVHHIEIQAQPESRFAQRMWIYYYRIWDKHAQRVVSLADSGFLRLVARQALFQFVGRDELLGHLPHEFSRR